MAKGGADDLNTVGPPEVVFPVLEEFWALVEANTGQFEDGFILYRVPMGTARPESREVQGQYVRHGEKEINSLCSHADLPAECKAYRVFSNLVPLNRLERHRTRQVLRPDFLLQVPDPATGVASYQVADVKTIGLGAVSYYRPWAEFKDEYKTVNRRSRRIHWE